MYNSYRTCDRTINTLCSLCNFAHPALVVSHKERKRRDGEEERLELVSGVQYNVKKKKKNEIFLFEV